MRVLVTGSSGYIGSVLVPMLLKSGHSVVGLDSGLFARSAFGEKRPDLIRTVRKDIRDVQIEDVQGFEAIIHLAGLSNDPLGDFDPELTFEINTEATIEIARLASRSGVKRFLYSSSCSCYGSAGESLINEESPFNPVTPYGESKVRVERILSDQKDSELAVTFLRNATAYGYSPHLRFDLVVNNLVAWAHTSGRVLLKSDGSPWRPLVHVEDIARAFVAVLEAPLEEVRSRAFNVGRTSENYQIRDVAQIVAKAMPDCRIEFSKDAGPDERCYKVNCDEILATLTEFKPQWNVERGVLDLCSVLSRVGLQREEFEGPRYGRLNQLKQLISEGYLDRSLRFKSPGLVMQT